MKKRHFMQIINQHKGLIRSLCQVYYQNSEDQKDAFQDVVLQLWKSFETFRGDSDISTWIYRVSLNTIISKKRKEGRSVATSSLDGPVSCFSDAKADDQMELLQLIIHSLKDVDKAIILLYLEGYRHKEIAEILKLTPTNVTTRFNRIKTQLTKKYNNQSHATKRP